MRDRTDHGKTADTVEQIIADNQRRAATTLLMAGLRGEIQPDDISLFKMIYHISVPSGVPHSSSVSCCNGAISSMGLP